MMTSKHKKAFKLIDQSKKVLLVIHINPDGDAFSSVCALIDIMKRLHKDFTAYCRDEVPIQFFFLPHIENLSGHMDAEAFSNHDLIISLDCGEVARTGLYDLIKNRSKKQTFIEFDHHPPRHEGLSDLEVRQPELSSTSELVYDFCKANNVKFTKELANCILTGIMTDTANFMYPNTTDKTMQVASEMLIYGAKYPRILQNTWRNKSFSAMKMWGEALGNLQINPEYNFAFSVLSHDTIKAGQASEEEMDGISSFLGNIYGVRGVLFLREQEPGQIRGSLRSNSDLDVSQLAIALGGGGHAKSAGFMLPGHLVRTDTGWQVV